MDTIRDGRTLAQAIVDTVRDALLVLDQKLVVVSASRSFYSTFQTTPEDTLGRKIYDIGNGEWNNPSLRNLLEAIVPHHGVIEQFEVEQDFPHIGHRTMLLNARSVFYEDGLGRTILLAIEDITPRKLIEQQLQVLLEQKDTLLQEMTHRIANSLQIIASILMLKARSVQSVETREHLEDAHRRVLSIATLQQHLQATGRGEEINVRTYLEKLCQTLAGSMIQSGGVTLDVVADVGHVPSDQAVSMGLIVTELVINALKHAFIGNSKAGKVSVAYNVSGQDWTLSVADNGKGAESRKNSDTQGLGTPGLGTSLINALSNQLSARIATESGSMGTKVSIIRARPAEA
jgi:PAS domain S-box-containing protein